MLGASLAGASAHAIAAQRAAIEAPPAPAASRPSNAAAPKAMAAAGKKGGRKAATARHVAAISNRAEQRWLKELLGADKAARLRARRHFLDSGPAAAPFLRKARRHGLRMQRRTGRILQRLAMRRILNPTLITLHFKHAQPEKIAKAISQQAGTVFSYLPPQMWTQHAWSRISFNATREPFWRVMALFQKKTNVGIGRWGNGPGVILQLLTPATPPPPTSYDGAVMTQVTEIQRKAFQQLAANPALQPPPNRSMNIQFSIDIEPKLPVLYTGPCVITKAVTDGGKSLVEPGNQNQNSFWSASDGFCQISAGSPLVDVRHSGKYINILQGYCTCVAATRVKAWTISNILRHRNKPLKKRFGGCTLVVKSVKASGANQWSVTVVLNNPAGGNQIISGAQTPAMAPIQPTMMNQQTASLQNSMALQDAEGRAFGSSEAALTQGARTTTMTLYFSSGIAPPFGMPAPAGSRPATLTLRLPLRFGVLKVPFAFHHVRLP